MHGYIINFKRIIRDFIYLFSGRIVGLYHFMSVLSSYLVCQADRNPSLCFATVLPSRVWCMLSTVSGFPWLVFSLPFFLMTVFLWWGDGKRGRKGEWIQNTILPSFFCPPRRSLLTVVHAVLCRSLPATLLAERCTNSRPQLYFCVKKHCTFLWFLLLSNLLLSLTGLSRKMKERETWRTIKIFLCF